MRRYFLLSALTLVLSSCQGPPKEVASKPSLQDLDALRLYQKHGLGHGIDTTLKFDEHTPPSLKPYIGKPAKEIRPAIKETGPVAFAEQARPKFEGEVLIYHSPKVTQGDYVAGGGIHARMLGNLIGHYANLKVSLAPISEYNSERAKKARRIFYMASSYDDVIPETFLQDIKAGEPVTWINYNLWKLGAEQLASMGLTYERITGAYTKETWEKTFNKIEYKNYTYDKYLAPMEMVEVSADPAKTEVAARALDSLGRKIPYAVRSDKFWYIADNPFTYIHPTDRYLVMSDLIHRMVGNTPSPTAEPICQPNAILRIEDLGAGTHPTGLKIMLDTIEELKIPFSMTLIPKFQYAGVDYAWKDNGEMLNLVYRAKDLGGIPIQHGFMHMNEGMKNLEGHSGVDWEFWNKAANAPISGMNDRETFDRIEDGRKILLDLGFNPMIWTTPHYEADTSIYDAINKLYPISLERRMYSEDNIIAGQFYPYAVRDKYNTLALPENLGNIQENYGTADIVEAAKANRGLQCPTASFFIHPYLLNPDYTGEDALKPEEFKKLLTDIQGLGYKFVSPLEFKVHRARMNQPSQ